MDTGLLQFLNDAMTSLFPTEWARTALMLALFSTLMVVVLFSYLNHHTKQGYFSVWTVAWLFYAIYLAASIGLKESPDQPFLMMTRRACIGVSAWYMFAGSRQLIRGVYYQRELFLGTTLIFLWSYFAAYQVQDRLWMTVPVFALLAAASVYTGNAHLQTASKYRGGRILALGFLAWGGLLLMFPFMGFSQVTEAVFYLLSAMLTIAITLGMLAQVLERAREENESLRGEFLQGIASRRILEQEVHLSEQKYRALFELASDAMFVVNLETLEIQEANQSAHRLAGREEGKLLDRRITDLCPELVTTGSSLLEHKRMFDNVFTTASEFAVVRANGARVPCEGTCTLVEYHQRPVIQISMREVTERKRLEKQMRQIEKLSALGQLIAGVAHELNNPLAVIMGYAQLLARQREADGIHKPAGEIEKILHESERAAKIVRNLLTFARSREPQMRPTDLNAIISNVLDTREQTFRDNRISVQGALAPTLPRTMADSGQLEQVLSNLVNNAIHALGDQSGTRNLTVTTGVVGTNIRISIADTGPGIPPELVERIFDPFFTTKAPGKGTGLGLSICHTILEEHRGRIWVDSQFGQGATFSIELPVVECREVVEQRSTEPAAPPPDPAAALRRILVVDDEPGILEVLQEVLSSLGYRVDTAINGNQALERIETARYDIIFSDLCMPEMGGETLYTAIQSQDAGLADRIIFVTGDTVSANSRSFLEATGNRWLSKPFNIAEVERLVAQTLGGQNPAMQPD
jgi:PAS domain S-box-containing protein